MNVKEIRDYLLSLEGSDKKSIRNAKRPELNRLLSMTLDDSDVLAVGTSDTKIGEIITIRSKNLTEAKKLKAPQGYKKVNVLSWHEKDTKYYELSPYHLKTEEGILFENLWQFSKVYVNSQIIKVKPHYSSKTIWWEYDKKKSCTTQKHSN